MDLAWHAASFVLSLQALYGDIAPEKRISQDICYQFAGFSESDCDRFASSGCYYHHVRRICLSRHHLVGDRVAQDANDIALLEQGGRRMNEDEILTQPPANAAPHYILAASDTDVCPSGFSILSSAAACETAAQALGLKWMRQESVLNFPSGCYEGGDPGRIGVFFNQYSPGQAHELAKPICGMPSFNVQYVLLEYNTNLCPSGLFTIPSVAACQTAAETLGFTWNRRENRDDWPSGCYDGYIDGQSGFWYNRATPGQAHKSARPICIKSSRYVTAESNTIGCPSGVFAISSASACKAIATATLQLWNGVETESMWPSGCYENVATSEFGSGLWFNRARGQAAELSKPVCSIEQEDCFDVAGFKDAWGYSCRDWRYSATSSHWSAKVSCEAEAREYMGYNYSAAAAVAQNCRKSCQLCSEDGKPPVFAYYLYYWEWTRPFDIDKDVCKPFFYHGDYTFHLGCQFDLLGAGCPISVLPKFWRKEGKTCDDFCEYEGGVCNQTTEHESDHCGSAVARNFACNTEIERGVVTDLSHIVCVCSSPYYSYYYYDDSYDYNDTYGYAYYYDDYAYLYETYRSGYCDAVPLGEADDNTISPRHGFVNTSEDECKLMCSHYYTSCHFVAYSSFDSHCFLYASCPGLSPTIDEELWTTYRQIKVHADYCHAFDESNKFINHLGCEEDHDTETQGCSVSVVADYWTRRGETCKDFCNDISDEKFAHCSRASEYDNEHCGASHVLDLPCDAEITNISVSNLWHVVCTCTTSRLSVAYDDYYYVSGAYYQSYYYYYDYYQYEHEDCVDVVVVTGAEEAPDENLQDAMGRYVKAIVPQSNGHKKRPIYQKGDKYLFYALAQRDWRIGLNYTEIKAWIRGGDVTPCPYVGTDWWTWNKTKHYNVSVLPECASRVFVHGAEEAKDHISSAMGFYEITDLVSSGSDKRYPVYRSGPNYLFYWYMHAKWLIGPNFTEPKSAVIQGGTDAFCPYLGHVWWYWEKKAWYQAHQITFIEVHDLCAKAGGNEVACKQMAYCIFAEGDCAKNPLVDYCFAVAGQNTAKCEQLIKSGMCSFDMDKHVCTERKIAANRGDWCFQTAGHSLIKCRPLVESGECSFNSWKHQCENTSQGAIAQASVRHDLGDEVVDVANVTLSIQVANVIFATLSADELLLSSFIEAAQRLLAQEVSSADVGHHQIIISVLAGSVVIAVTITGLRDAQSLSVQSKLKEPDDFFQRLAAKVNTLPGMAAAISGIVSASYVRVPTIVVQKTFNCKSEFLRWETEWSREKKKWCCERELRGCEAPTPTPTAAPTPTPTAAPTPTPTVARTTTPTAAPTSTPTAVASTTVMMGDTSTRGTPVSLASDEATSSATVTTASAEATSSTTVATTSVEATSSTTLTIASEEATSGTAVATASEGTAVGESNAFITTVLTIVVGVLLACVTCYSCFLYVRLRRAREELKHFHSRETSSAIGRPTNLEDEDDGVETVVGVPVNASDVAPESGTVGTPRARDSPRPQGSGKNSAKDAAPSAQSHEVVVGMPSERMAPGPQPTASEGVEL